MKEFCEEQANVKSTREERVVRGGDSLCGQTVKEMCVE